MVLNKKKLTFKQAPLDFDDDDDYSYNSFSVPSRTSRFCKKVDLYDICNMIMAVDLDYTCDMMIFCEENLTCATLKLRPNSLPGPWGRQFIC